ncbi:MAG: Mu transposase C-terminal domain-containing protein [Candidatus Competibacter sp.]|nr:Mu transposase C-terminal domain-containing protein [Candidatus Competibacter sp.]MDG4583366.1 Mu transposase C-terminal domain-containing protein [Candidatus Competibacter sp.]
MTVRPAPTDPTGSSPPPPDARMPALSSARAVSGSVRAASGDALTPAFSANDTAHLKDWQRRCLDARLALLQDLDRRMLMQTTARAALDSLIADAHAQQLPVELQALVPVAARSGELSRRTLTRWVAERAQGLTQLAPQSMERFQQVPVWAGPLLKLWQRPQKPALKWALAELAMPDGAELPSYSQARRFLKKMDAVDRERGRMGPRELKNIRPYQRRDASYLWPAEIYSMDGHKFDAEIAHPFHGQPFRPEITTAIDVATRRLVGWSVALAESSLAVLDALRHSVENAGIPAVLYVDNGSGYVNALMEDPATGFMARLGITKKHSMPYNSQARGVIERLHRTVWVRLAKDFATYMGADMDDEIRKRVHKITQQDIKAVGRSRLLPQWPDFLARCEKAAADYNNQPHSSLPKIIDAATGKVRHQTPNESWAELTATHPECVVAIAPDEVADLFRPYKTGITRRGQVQLFGNVYYSADLKGFHGDTVFIGYDLHDPSRVWVRDRNQRLIAVAQLDGNKSSYMPISALEHAHRTRAKGRKARLERRMDEVQLELQGSRPVIEGRDATPEEKQMTADTLARIAAENAPPPPADPNARPARFTTDLELWRWVQDHPDLATAQDRSYLDDCLKSSTFRLQVEIEEQKKSRVSNAA